MPRASDLVPAGSGNTAELQAMTLLREVREHGGYVLLDLQGSIHIRHIERIPPELTTRMVWYYDEIVRILLNSIE
jgi:hypothetical protein